MTTPLTTAQLRQNAQDDLTDIEALSSSQPFNRYFARRLNALYRDAVTVSLTAKTVEEREAARHRANLLNELSNMPAADREKCEKFLRTPEPGPTRPTQAG